MRCPKNFTDACLPIFADLMNSRLVTSSASKQELEVFWAESIHGNFVVVDRASNHGSLLFLKSDHTRLDTVLDTQTSDHAGSPLTYTMASIG
jgi:hypothetical protein